MRKNDPGRGDLLAEMGYEPKDINFNQVMTSIFALIGFFVFSIVAILLFYTIFVPDWVRLGRQEPIPTNRRLPPHPQVQADPRRDFELYRQAEDRLLEGKDLDGKTARGISVESAIEIMANERGIAGVRGNTLERRGTGYPGMLSEIGEFAHPGAGHSTDPSLSTNEKPAGETPIHVPGAHGVEANDGSSTESFEAQRHSAPSANGAAGHGASPVAPGVAEPGGH